jgi:hypothetical protein
MPPARPGAAALFPWLQRERRAAVWREFTDLLRLRLPAGEAPGPLARTVQGLGLIAVTSAVLGGTVSYLGYYTRTHVSDTILHWMALELSLVSWFVWTFVIGHVSMAAWHRFSGVAGLTMERDQ